MSKILEKLLSHKDAEVRRESLENFLEYEKDISKAIPLILKQLEDENWRVRKTAVEALLGIKGETVTRAFIDTLNNADSVNARNSAIEALIALGDEATDHLIEKYKDSSKDVKKFIIDILGKTKDLKALPLLLKAIEDKNENVRAAAVEHLGNIKGHESVINALTGILVREDIWVAYPAVEALGRIGDSKAVDALISVLPQAKLREPVIRALGRIAESGSFPSIVPFLKDKSRSIREVTIEAIEQFYRKGIKEEVIIKSLKNILGNKASDILLPCVKSNKKDVRVASILLLGLIKDKRAVPLLLEISVEDDANENIEKVLAYIAKSAPEFLIPFFGTGDSYQRRIICEVAGKTGAPAFFNHLIRCLKDEDGHVRGNAAIALSHLNNPEAIKHIKRLLLDEYENVQEEAIKSLSKFKKWLDIDEIKKGLLDKNHILQRNTVILLGLIGNKNSIEALGITLKSSSVKVRISVVQALGAIGGANAVKFLFLALTDEFAEVRRVAAIAIGRIRSNKGLQPLILLLSDIDVKVRAASAEALGRLGNKKAVDPLLGLLKDESGFVRTATIESLANFKEEKVKDSLLKLLNDNDAEIRSTAVEALKSFDSIAQDILPLLKDKEWSVRKTVVDVLGRFFRDQSYAYLKEVSDTDEDTEVRETAARYLSV